MQEYHEIPKSLVEKCRKWDKDIHHLSSYEISELTRDEKFYVWTQEAVHEAELLSEDNYLLWKMIKWYVEEIDIKVAQIHKDVVKN